MDLSEGFVGQGGAGRSGGQTAGTSGGKTLTAAGRGREGEEQNSEAMERLVVQVRETLDRTIHQRLDRFSPARSEVILNQVLVRLKENQRRGAWLIRAARRLAAFGATLWNSRAMRMLVP